MLSSVNGWLGLPMVTGWPLLVIFVCGVILLLILIIKVKLNPFLAMLISCLAIGFAANMPIFNTSYTVLEDGVEIVKTQTGIVNSMTSGFGNTLASVGIVIALGIVFGNILSEAQATQAIAKGLLKLVGVKRAALAIAIAGFLISIPVFMDAAFIIMMPIVKYVARLTNRSIFPYVCALGVGTIVGHCMIIPTPGPMAVAEAMGANIGGFLLYALIAGIVAVIVGGWLYGFVFRNHKAYEGEEGMVEDSLEVDPNGPSLGLSMMALLVPILLILVSNILCTVMPDVEIIQKIFGFLGEKNIALLISVFASLAILLKYIKKNQKPFHDIVIEAADTAGLILLVTGAGGSFGTVINNCGIGTAIVDLMSNAGIPMVVLGFVLSLVLRMAQGSATVALVTTSGILGPALASAMASGATPALGGSAVLVGLAICAGGIGFSLPNDSGFWVLSRFSGITVADTLKSWTVASVIASVSAFAVILLISIIGMWIPLPLL